VEAVSPVLTWEGPGEVPSFCPEGCGGLTEDVYGGPCKACWAAVDREERAAEGYGRCTWCHRGGDLNSSDGNGQLFCDEDCADAYREEWGDDA